MNKFLEFYHEKFITHPWTESQLLRHVFTNRKCAQERH